MAQPPFREDPIPYIISFIVVAVILAAVMFAVIMESPLGFFVREYWNWYIVEGHL